MARVVKLVFEFEAGAYDEDEEVPMDEQTWLEYFHQADLFPDDFNLIEIRVEESDDD